MHSHYLDDIPDLLQGHIVVCKCDMTGEGFTEGQTYVVGPDRTLINDAGRVVVNSSARFIRRWS